MKRFYMPLVFILCIMLGINTSTLIAQSAKHKKAALVVTEPELSAGFDGAMFNRLLSLGYDVSVVTGGDVSGGSFTKADAESYDLLVISESIGSGDVTPIAGSAVPILHMESFGWSKQGWTESAGRGWTATNGYIDINTETAHTILSKAGLSAQTDSLLWFTVDSLQGTSILASSLPAGAKILAGKQDSLVYSWTVEKGVMMANGSPAAARIATIPIPGYPTATYEASVLTDEGWAFFDAAVAWLDVTPDEFIGSAAMVASDAGLTAGFDGAMFNRLLSLGYDVSVVTGGDVSGGSFTKADAESYDLLVISESIGSGDVTPIAGSAVPILHMESFGWSKQGWTESAGRGWTATNGYIDINTGTAHTILSKAGLSAQTDSLLWFTVDSLQGTSILASSLPAGAKILAGKQDSLVYSWTVEKGVMMANGSPAAARIATIPIPGYPTATYEASVLTDEGWAFFDAAVAWLGAAPDEFIGSAAMVASDAGLTAGFDGAMFNRLLSLGYDVSVVTGGDVSGGSFTKADAESYDLLVISESIGSGDVTPIAGSAVPILHMESFGWSKQGWTESAGRGWTATNGYIDINTGTAHTILSKAGLSAQTDSLLWFTVDSLQGTSILASSLPAGAKILAGKQDSLVYSWTVEKGVMMANGNPAAARIATIPIPGYPTATYEASVLTDEGWAFFDAAVAWLGAAPDEFIGSAAMVASDAGLTAGFDGAMFNRLLSLGYDVSVVTGGDVSGGSFTKADAESYDLLVISESIGSGDVTPIAGSAVPILHMESFGWSKQGWTESAGRGWTATNGYIDINTGTAHTILSKAGLSAQTDSLLWFTVDSLQGTSILASSLPAGAKILAGKQDSLVYSWTVEKGVMMANGNPAAARIATIPIPGYPTATYEASVLTDEGWAFFDAAVAWLGAAPDDYIGSAAMVASDAGLTAGFDGAMFNRLLSLGYDVSVVTGGDVSGGSFTKADAESYDILVISESIGSGDVTPIAGSAVPILHMESFGWSKQGWTESAGRGWTATNGYIDINAGTAHTILSNAGLSAQTDSLLWFTVDSLQGTSILASSLPAGAKILAGKQDSLVYSWTVEKGVMMANGNPAAARIATIPIPGYPTATYEASVLTDEGWAFFDAAVLWLTPPPSTGEIEPGIVSRYEFELGVSDKEGNFDGSLEGDAAIIEDPERGNVLELTDDGYVSIDPALANELKDFSIVTWMKGLGTAEFGGLFGIGQIEADTNSYWDIHLQSNGTMSFYASKDSLWPPDGCAQIVDDFVNPGDDWYHIAVTFKRSEGAIVYVNGEAQTTSDWMGANDFDVSPMDVAAKMVAIGKDAYTQSTLTNTLIDNFTVYNIAISESAVESLYNGEMHIPAPKLVAEYVFDYDAKDATGKHDGTLQGDATLVRDEDRGTVLSLTSDGYVSLPSEVTNVLDDFSISAWVKGVASSGTPALLGMGSGTAQSAPYWDIQLNGDGTMSFASSLANTTDPDGCAIAVNDFTNDGSEWNHIVLAFTKDAGAVVYINGKEADTTWMTGENDFSVSPSDLGATMVAIGKSAFSQQTLDATLIDDFKIYKNAINADDVKEIFQNETPPPSGGGGSFTYSLNTSVLYDNGGAAFDNYDGFWAHENGNDEWDGSGIGEGAPGGISIIDDYYRFQDCGDPNDMGAGDPNKKLQGYCDLGAFGGSPTMLDDGATIHFVARIPTDGPLDELISHADGSRFPYPEAGDGYVHHNDGTLGMIAIKQGAGGYISFTLRTEYDTLDHDLLPVGKFVGLQMQPAKGNALILGSKVTAADTINTIKLDPTEWHDYWVNIEKDATGVGTHTVSISVDGGEFQSFSVTATTHSNYLGKSVLRMGMGASFESGALDIKAFDFAPGLLPAPALPNAHWKFEGDATDEYGTSDGTLIEGDASAYVEGLEGQGMALDLPGTLRYIEVPDNDVVDTDTNSFTYSMLVQTPDFVGDRELLFKGNNDDAVDGHWTALALHDNNLWMYIDDKVTKTEFQTPNIDQVLVAGQWNHVVAIRDRAKNKLFIYINGLEYSSMDDATEGSLSSSLPLRIGTNAAGDVSAKTLMDEVQLFHSALSAQEVANLYATYVPQLPGNLKAYWKLDGDAMDYFETSDGTLVGGDSANYVAGHTDQALDLSIGTDPTYVEVADNSIINVAVGEFTYSMLLKVTDFDSNREILHKGSTDNAWYALSLDGTNLSFTIDDGTNETSVVINDANKHLYDTTWNHIAAIRDRIQDSIFLYINQRIAGSAKANTNGSIGSALPLIIGAGENMDVKFNGMLDEMRFYDEPIGFTDLQSLSRAYGIDPKYIPSSNANLSTITLLPGAPLSPAFDKNVYDYTCELLAGTESVRVTAFPEDFKSIITGTGVVDVSSGTGTSTLVVTAEDGTVNTYTIDFTVATTGIDEVSITDLKVIYNPSENCLIFENRDNIERVEIFSINGSKLYIQEKITSGRLNLNPANLPGNAVYISRIYTADEIGVFKFVKLNSY